MEPIPLLIVLIASGLVLLVAELLLPTHGLLGVLGVGCCGAGLIIVFMQNKWMGLLVFFGAIVLSPLLWAGTIKLWTKSPIGKRVILQPLQTVRASSPVSLGDIGTAATVLRPMGECDFGELRIEVVSELGIINTGTRVKVVSFNNGRPTVRPV